MTELERRKPGTKWTKAQLAELQDFCADKNIDVIADKFYKGSVSVARQAMWNYQISYKRKIAINKNKLKRAVTRVDSKLELSDLDKELSTAWIDVV